MPYSLKELNEAIRSDPKAFAGECDAAFAKKVSNAAKKIAEHREESRVVLLSGPSGSGKTTTALKIEEQLEKMGIETHTNVTVGKEITFEQLQQEYDCLYISIGAHQGKGAGIPGEHSKNVMSAVEMLRGIGDGEMPDFSGKRVVVIGGGNVAMDVTRSSIRLGAEKVTCVYRRRIEDMTALPDEVTGAMAEGAEMLTLMAPVRIEANENDEAVALWVH